MASVTMEKLRATWALMKEIYDNRPWKYWKTLTTDNFVFTLHYPLTPLLLVFVAILTLFFDDIECYGNQNYMDYVNARCLSSQTLVKPPIENLYAELSFYDFVPTFIVIQAFFFIFPCFIFRHDGRDSLSKLVHRQNIRKLTAYADWEKRERSTMNIITKEVYGMLTSGDNTVWVRNLFFCDILNLLNDVLQFVVLYFFANTPLASDGYLILQQMFPSVVQCEVKIPNERPYNDLCLLGLSGIYEGVILFMLIWLLLLALLTSMSIILRFTRYVTFNKRGCRSKLSLMLLGYCTLVPDLQEIQDVLHACSSVGDLLMLNYLALNLDELVFRKLVHGLKMRMENVFPKSVRSAVI